MKKVLGTIPILLLLMTLGCTKHQVETKSQVEVAPVEIKPIRVDKALDDFFSDIDESAQEIE